MSTYSDQIYRHICISVLKLNFISLLRIFFLLCFYRNTIKKKFLQKVYFPTHYRNRNIDEVSYENGQHITVSLLISFHDFHITVTIHTCFFFFSWHEFYSRPDYWYHFWKWKSANALHNVTFKILKVMKFVE